MNITQRIRLSWHANKSSSVICTALALWMIVYWFQTARLLWVQYTGFPLQDYWLTVVNLPRYEHFDLSVLWEQHNEHRILVPEFIYAIDSLLFGAHQYLPIALSTLFQIATFVIAAKAIWIDRLLSPGLRMAAILLAGIVLGWPGIAYVLSWPFEIQWTIVQALVAAALLTIARGRIVLPLACGVAATFSAGHGMLIWPLLLLAALALRLPRRQVAAVLFTGIAAIALYFYHLIPSNDVQRRMFLKQPTWFFGFLSSMLSMPFSADRRVLGLWLGPLSFILFLVICLIAWRARLLRERTSIVLLGLCLFSLATILVCGMGRTLPTYWDYPTAKVARYLSVPLCYWASLFALTLWVLSRTYSSNLAAWAALVLFSGGMAYQLPRLNPWLRNEFDIYARQQSIVVAMEAGVNCPSLIEQDLYPVPQHIPEWNPILKQRRLSVYSDSRFEWIGKPVASVLSVQPAGGNKGTVTTILPFRCAMQLAGFIEGGGRELVLVNEHGVVAGLGRRLRAGLPLYLPNQWLALPIPENWTAFVNYSVPSAMIQLYQIATDGRSAAPFGPPVPVPLPDQRKP